MDFVYNAEKIKKCRKSLTATEKSGIIFIVYLYTDYHTYNIIQIMMYVYSHIIQIMFLTS